MADNKTIYTSLANIQQELKVPKTKNAMGRYNFRSYEDILEAVKPILKKNGCCLTVSDEIIHIKDEGVFINSSLDNKGEPVKTKESLSRYYVKATATLFNNKGDSITVTANAREQRARVGLDAAQLTGSSSSYARKYALGGLFGLDDSKDIDEK